jgi:tyrosyl-tRNA synthetase
MDLIRQVGEEIVTEDELRHVLRTNSKPAAYDGFEPSGKIHIAQGILRAININKMLKAGIKFKMLVADWYAYMNNKMGGDMERIRKVGEYYIEVWKACGLKTGKIDFVWANDLIQDPKHLETTLKIAKAASVKRIMRTSQIMGRKSGEGLSGAQIFYPCMQAADIYRLECEITQLGMDQRKVNMLAREIGPKIGLWKPVVISHHMILGLSKPQSQSKDPADMLLDMKMSKSRPESAIFMEDSSEDIKRKIKNAYCPAKQVELNPVLEYCKYIVFPKFKEMEIERSAKFGGNVTFSMYGGLEEAFTKGDLHPADLKTATADYIDKMIDPIRVHFKRNAKARRLLEYVRRQHVTR